jgi:hypothetical protein
MEGPYQVKYHAPVGWLRPNEYWEISGLPIPFYKQELAEDFCYMLNWAHKMRKLKEKEKKE